MKVGPGQVTRLLEAPGSMRVILLHGEDAGLIRERATEAVRAAAGTVDDPFRLATLSRDAHDRLEEEVSALSLTGGRRVVWIREATDALSLPLKRALSRLGDSLVVLEGYGLASRSKLRAQIEAMPDGASIACYPEEGRALQAQVTRMLADRAVKIDPDALVWLCSRLGADRVAIRGEVEKLVLYAGEEGRITLDDAMECAGDAATASLDDAVFAAAEGDRVGADLAIERCFGEGTSSITIARTLLSHLHRLRQARLVMEQGGISAQEAMRQLRPPVFFKRTQAFGRALSLWSVAGLLRAADQTQALELACKQTGAPDLVLCKRHLAVVAGQARTRR